MGSKNDKPARPKSPSLPQRTGPIGLMPPVSPDTAVEGNAAPPFLFGKATIEDLYRRYLRQMYDKENGSYRYFVVKRVGWNDTALTKKLVSITDVAGDDNMSRVLTEEYFQLPPDKQDPYSDYNIHIVQSTDGNGLRMYAGKVLPRPNDIIFWLENNDGDKYSDATMLCRMGEDVRKLLQKRGMLQPDSNVVKNMSSILNLSVDDMVKLLTEGEAYSDEVLAYDVMGKILNFMTVGSALGDIGLVTTLLDKLAELIRKLKINEETWLPKNKEDAAAPAALPDTQTVIAAAAESVKDADKILTQLEQIIATELKSIARDNGFTGRLYRSLLQQAQIILTDGRAAVAGVSQVTDLLDISSESIRFAFLCGTVNGFIEGIAGLIILVKLILQLKDLLANLKEHIPSFLESLDKLLPAWEKFKFSEFFKTLKERFAQFLQSLADEIADGIDEEEACRLSYFAGNVTGMLLEMILEIFATGGAAAVVKFFDSIRKAGTKVAGIFTRIFETILKLSLKDIQRGTVTVLEVLASFFVACKEKMDELLRVIFQELKSLFGIGLKPETELLFEQLGIVYKRIPKDSGRYLGAMGSAINEKVSVIYYKGRRVFWGSKKEVEEVGEQLREMNPEAQRKFLEELAEKSIKLTAKSLELLDDYAKASLIKWGKRKRPGVVAIMEGNINDKLIRVINYSGKRAESVKIHPLVEQWLQAQENVLKLKSTFGKCGEIACLSEYLFEVEKILKTKSGELSMKTAIEILENASSHARALHNASHVEKFHNTFKAACITCQKMLKDFNIKEIKL